MHLLFVSGTAQSAHNGSSRVERALAVELSRHARVTLLTRDTQVERGAPYSHRIYRRPSSKPWKTWLLASAVAQDMLRIHREEPIDLVHGFAFFPVCLYVERFAALTGLPYVLTQHSMELDPPSRWLLARPTTRALLGARAVTCLSDAQQRRIVELGVPIGRTCVIENGVDPPRAHERAEIPLPDRFVLFAGRLEEEKGIHLLLDALEQLPAVERPAVVIAGDGRDREEVEKRALRIGAITIGWRTHHELMAVLSRAAAVVMPSFTEAAPLLPLEAFARGVPVAMHALDGLEKLAEHAIILPLGDRGAWSRLLASIARGDPIDGASERAARAKELAREATWEMIAQRYLHVYRAQTR